jgi:hypothetical protein
MSGSALTMTEFYDVPLGLSPSELVERIGEPYAVHRRDDGSLEYEYIERFKAGGRNIQDRHYFIIVKDGKVISKYVEQRNPWPYYLEYFDSYDMQTTQNQ